MRGWLGWHSNALQSRAQVLSKFACAFPTPPLPSHRATCCLSSASSWLWAGVGR